MIISLFTSKKIGSVTKTEVNLARQDEGQERFGSSPVSRAIVSAAVALNKTVERVMPSKMSAFFKSRFDSNSVAADNGISFDAIRATVNLTAAAILICVATSYKLPLSTTYVTFMVAMGTSLADRAWGRESAVYRITGVLAVISGWFFTAFMGFTLAFVIGLILMYGGFYGLGAMAAIAVYIIIQSNIIHRRRKAKSDDSESEEIAVNSTDIMRTCADDICKTLDNVMALYHTTMEATYSEDRKALKNAKSDAYNLYDSARSHKYKVYTTLYKLEENYVKSGHYFVQVVDYTNEVTRALYNVTKGAYLHIQNNHQGFTEDQVNDLRMIESKVKVIYDMILYILRNDDYSKLDDTQEMRDSLFEDFAEVVKKQIQRIKMKETSTRSSMLYLDIINETKTMVLQARNLIKSQNYFVNN